MTYAYYEGVGKDNVYEDDEDEDYDDDEDWEDYDDNEEFNDGDWDDDDYDDDEDKDWWFEYIYYLYFSRIDYKNILT